eukprot:gene1019-571_t
MVSDSLHDTAANQAVRQIRTFTREERHATGKGWCAGGKGGTGFKPKKKSQWVTQEEYNKIQGIVAEHDADVHESERFSHDHWVDAINHAIDTIESSNSYDISFERQVFLEYITNIATNDPIDFNECQSCRLKLLEVESLLKDQTKLKNESECLKLQFRNAEFGSAEQSSILKTLMNGRKLAERNKSLLSSLMMLLLCKVVDQLCNRQMFSAAQALAVQHSGGMGGKGFGRGSHEPQSQEKHIDMQIEETTRSDSSYSEGSLGGEQSCFGDDVGGLGEWVFQHNSTDDHAAVRRSSHRMFVWLTNIFIDRFLLQVASLEEARDLYLNDATLDWMHAARTFAGLDLAFSKDLQMMSSRKVKGKHTHIEALSLAIAIDTEYFLLFGHTWTDESLEAVLATCTTNDKFEILLDLERQRKYGPQKYRLCPWRLEKTVGSPLCFENSPGNNDSGFGVEWIFEYSPTDGYGAIQRATQSMLEWMLAVQNDMFLLHVASLEEAKYLNMYDASLEWIAAERTFAGLDLAGWKDAKNEFSIGIKGKHRSMEALSLAITFQHRYFHLLRDRVTDIVDEYFPMAAPGSIGVISVSGHTWTDESLEAVLATYICRKKLDKVAMLNQLGHIRQYGPEQNLLRPWRREVLVCTQPEEEQVDAEWHFEYYPDDSHVAVRQQTHEMFSWISRVTQDCLVFGLTESPQEVHDFGLSDRNLCWMADEVLMFDAMNVEITDDQVYGYTDEDCADHREARNRLRHIIALALEFPKDLYYFDLLRQRAEAGVISASGHVWTDDSVTACSESNNCFQKSCFRGVKMFAFADYQLYKKFGSVAQASAIWDVEFVADQEWDQSQSDISYFSI